MTEPLSAPKKSVGVLPVLVAALAFVPVLGVLLGIPSIAWGFITRARGGLKVAAVAGAGVLLNVMGLGALFYLGFAKSGGRIAEARLGLTQMNLHQAVLGIEYWHQQN